MTRFKKTFNFFKRGNYIPFKNNFGEIPTNNSVVQIMDKFKPLFFSIFLFLTFVSSGILNEEIASKEDIEKGDIVIKEEIDFLKYYTNEYLDILKVGEVNKKK